MSTIVQGTTPALRIVVPTSEFAVADVQQLEIAVWQEGSDSFKVYGLEDVTVDEEANAYEIQFTEADTLALEQYQGLCWQMHCKFSDGSIVGTAPSDSINVAPKQTGREMS